MNRIIKIATLVFLFTSTWLSASSQTYPVQINLNLSSPYPTNYDAYVDHLSNGFVQLNNTGLNPLEVYLKVKFVENSGRVSISSPLNLTQGLLLSPGINILSTQDIEDIFSNVTENDFYTAGLNADQRQAMIVNKQLPEGSYTLCLYAYDENQKLLSDPMGMGCIEFELYYPERPIIDQPIQDEAVMAMGSFNIMWSHYLTSVDALARTEYVVKIIDVTEQEIKNIPNAFLDPGISPDYEENVGITRSKFIQDFVDLPLVQDHIYAVRVTAVDPQEEVLYQNGGHSEIVVFTYGEKEDANKLKIPTLVKPEFDMELALGNNLDVQWEHDVQDASKLKYRLRVIDQTDSKNGYSISTEDLVDGNFIEVVNTAIKSTDTTINTSSEGWIEGHDYLVVIQVTSSEEEDEFLANGMGGLVSVEYGKTLEKEPKKKKPNKPEVAKVKPDKIKKTKATEGNCDPGLLVKLSKDKDSLISVKLEKNKDYKFGNVLFQVKSKDGDPESGYKGKGYITVKLGERNVKVNLEFLELKVNKGGRVIAGRGNAVIEDQAKELGEMTSIVQGATDLDSAQIMKLYSFAKNQAKNARIEANKDVDLPVGVSKTVGTETMTIGIVDMQFTPQRATMAALFSINNKSWGKHIPLLGADQICFTSAGPGDNVRLYLAKDYNIPGTKGDMILKASKKDGKGKTEGTYVLMNKSGFVEGQISAEFGISTKELYAENEDGDILKGETVKLFVSGNFKSSNNFILQARISPFQIPGLTGFGFDLENGFYDNSDFENPTAIAFPEGHPNKASDVTWKGVWFAKAKVRAPRDWGGANGKERTNASVSFIKDNFGVHLKGEINNILGIETGEFEGFAFSIDKVSFHILKNEFQGVKTFGKIGLPLLPEGKYLDYLGTVDQPKKDSVNQKQPLSIAYTITPDKTGYDIEWLKAHIDFDTSTYFLLKNDKKEKGVDVRMSGLLSLETDAADVEVKIPGLKFEGMRLSKLVQKDATKSKDTTNGKLIFIGPKFSIAGTSGKTQNATNTSATPGNNAVSQTSKQQLNGFSVTLNEVKMKMKPGPKGVPIGASLLVDGSVNLVGASKKGNKGKQEGLAISADASFIVKCKISGNRVKDLKFKYDGFDMGKMKVDAKISGIGLKGEVEFFKDDQVFGNGTRGSLEVTTPLLVVELDALFGNTKDYQYWYVFGEVGVGNKAKSGFPAPLASVGAISLYGFHGGAYYHMTDKGSGNKPAERYVPEASTYLGLKAGITFSVSPKPQDFFAKATAGFEFNISGGLNNITVRGDAYLLKTEMVENPITGQDGTNVVGVQALLDAKLNFKTSNTPDFSADMLVFTNVKTAAGTFKGIANTTNLVVEADLNIKGDKWNLWIGTQKEPGQVSFTLAGLGLTVSGGGYLMVGNKRLPPIEEPSFMKEWFGPSGFSAGAVEKSLPNNGGFAFGANLKYELNLKASILYADFKAIFGFDLQLVNSEGVVCSNLPNSPPLGLDGWYAKGQVYGGLSGDIGLEIDIFFYSGKISLASMQAAMLLSGGLPNPIWVNGRAQMKYSVLGGLVSGSTGFNIQFGEKCVETQTDEFSQKKFIAFVSPGNTTKNVSVFVDPVVTFQSKIGKDNIYEIKMPGSNDIREFYTYVDEIKLFVTKTKKGTNGQVIFRGMSEILFQQSAMLDGQTDYTFKIVIKAMSRLKGGTDWVIYKRKKDNKEWSDEEEVKFRTGIPPDHIPERNVKMMYPFYKEYGYIPSMNKEGRGFVQLKKTQDYIFKHSNLPDEQWHARLIVVFETNPISGPAVGYGRSPIKNVGHFVHFDIPKELPKDKYVYMYFRREYYLNPAFKEEVAQQVESIKGSDFEVKLEGKVYQNYVVDKPGHKEIFYNMMKVSKYGSFNEMMNDGNNTVVHKPYKNNFNATMYYKSTRKRQRWPGFDKMKNYELKKEHYYRNESRNLFYIEDLTSPYFKDLARFYEVEKSARIEIENKLREKGLSNVNYGSLKQNAPLGSAQYPGFENVFIPTRYLRNAGNICEQYRNFVAANVAANGRNNYVSVNQMSSYTSTSGQFLIAPSAAQKLTYYYRYPIVIAGQVQYNYVTANVTYRRMKDSRYKFYK